MQRYHAAQTQLSFPQVQAFSFHRLTLIAGINVLLLSLALGLIAYYMIAMNGIAANRYRATTLNRVSAELTEEKSGLAQRAFRLEDIGRLISYAEQNGLVEMKTALHIFPSGRVAIHAR